MLKLQRRQLMNLVIAATANQSISPLARAITTPSASASAKTSCFENPLVSKWGALKPRLPRNANMLKNTAWGDLSQTPLIKLPDTCSYTAVSITGHKMSDGHTVPGSHDGMACFWGEKVNGQRVYRLVRNHELHNNSPYAIPTSADTAFDTKVKAGGTSTVVINSQGQVIKDFISLSGTIRNCSGGPTPWQTWISCEETVDTPSFFSSLSKKHGYCFEVDPMNEGLTKAKALTALGRFNREAIAIDPQSGKIYQTEDRADSCFYCFHPKQQAKKFGDLAKTSGDLYALAIKPGQKSSCQSHTLRSHRDKHGEYCVDSRSDALHFLGQTLEVSWIKLSNIDPEKDTLRYEAQSQGATLFARAEGVWYSEGKVYFCCTTGGDKHKGQIWSYSPQSETITLIAEATEENSLDMPDAITVGSDGTLYLCEDGKDDLFGKQRVVGLTPQGQLFPFIETHPPMVSEFAGACFSPDGNMFFVNLQGSGITLCVSSEHPQGFSVS